MVVTKAVIFDLDGTLIDSVGDIHAALNVMLASRGAGPLDMETVRGFIGKGSSNLVMRCLHALDLPCGPDDHAAALDDFITIYTAGSANHTRLFVGDSEIDRETAQAASQDFALFTKGYRKTSVAALNPRYHFDNFAALPNMVEAFYTSGQAGA